MQNGPKSHGTIHSSNTIHGIVGKESKGTVVRNTTVEQRRKDLADSQNTKGTGVKVAKTATSEAEALAYRKKVANVRAKGSAAVR